MTKAKELNAILEDMEMPAAPAAMADEDKLTPEEEAMCAEATKMLEADPSLAPPKKWAEKILKHAKDAKDPGAVLGAIWYHHLSPEMRKEIRAREGKHYGPANKE